MSDEQTVDAEHIRDIERIRQVDLQKEMQRSYLDYAMSVIVGRALPDVRDGLKPVHRRILYAMYDGGYRPTSSFSKSSRIVGDVMGNYHPHGDAAIYDALARLVQPWSLRAPLVAGQGNFGTPGNLGPAAPRYTECKMAPLAMEMVRDIDEECVDFQDNYDGRNQEPTILPSRFPNVLVNGSEGIAVGMATRIPPHNLREVARGVQWALEHPEASREELLEALLKLIPGPDFPTGATILGRRGIEDAYRTGRGSITQRAVVNVEEIHGRIINHHGKETIIASLTGSITECDIDIMQQLKAEIDLAEQHKQECMDKMLAICENEYSTQLHNLQTIPGVKMRAATSLIAEIGTDMSHFETANHLASWSGLKPRNDQSNKTIKSRRITYGNRYLRRTIIQCSWGASRTKNCFFSRFSYHQTQVRKKNRMKVQVAIARKMLICAWHILKDGVSYKDFNNIIEASVTNG